MSTAIRQLPYLLAGTFLVFWCALAIAPVDRAVWWAENLPVMAIFLLLAGSYRWFRFSNAAYAFMSVWLFWHTVGGHYTFAHVPFDAVTEFFGFERNHFDRVGHFSIGLYAFAIVELLMRRRLATPATSYLMALFAIMSVAAAYEIIEWWYAVLEGGQAGVEFLGSQGDVWDAQKDMLLDTLGAFTALAAYWCFRAKAGPKFP